MTTVDHKRIGLLYGVAAFFFFLVGGIEAVLIRLQLSWSGNTFVSAETFNQLFTMHGTTMIFLVVMPLNACFFNYLIPLMIGARDVAFPRLNALSYWIFLFGSLFLNASFLFDAAPNAGWVGYANLTSTQFSPGQNIDFWVLGLQVLGVSSLVAGFNFIVTILNMRAPGMIFMRLPAFVWMTLITQFLIILAFPAITVGLFLLMFDRFFGTNFYNPAMGGNTLLWQHLFWLFGHPEVYILILPGMGIVSEVLPTFAKKPLFGYPVIVYSGILIAFFGFAVWSHHMFTVGLGPMADSAFSLATMLIAIPTGVKIFNWIATLWGGALRLRAPLYFALGFIAMFLMGGLSGIMHASPPVDMQQQDSYFVVAHLHYVLVGGSLFALFSGIYYWWPKMTGRVLNERLGKLNFWLLFIGFNVTFFPMHLLGLMGMPRRIYTYQGGLEWEFWNLVSTIGAFVIALSVLVFLVNAIASLRAEVSASPDPWDGRTLEWTVPSPPPVHNFDEIPTVRHRDELWARKAGRRVAAPAPLAGGSGDGGDRSGNARAATVKLHVPAPSFYPIVVAGGIILVAAGGLTYVAVSVLGGLFTVLGIYRWAFEYGGPGRPRVVPFEETSTGLDHRKMAFWAFLGSECMFFGSLIATYMAYKGRSLAGPYPSEMLNIPLTSISTFVLLMSSLLMVLALASVQRNDKLGAKLWLFGTALLGMVFLSFQAYEFVQFVHEGLTLQANLFGATFFVLTGFHGVHVSAGVLWLLSLWVLALRERLTPADALVVEIAGLYWHFVDIVWIAIFTLVYLIQ
ncbi:MAG: cytochrome c oxidase subunit I [Anaerolineae bacterium]